MPSVFLGGPDSNRVPMTRRNRNSRRPGGFRVGYSWRKPRGAAFGHGEVELAQVHAAQVIRQVRGGELQQFGDEAHSAMIVRDYRRGYRVRRSR